MKLVTTDLEWSYAAGETDVRGEMLQAAAELLTLGRDAVQVFDGAEPGVKARPSDPAEQESTRETQQGSKRNEAGEVTKPLRTKRTGSGGKPKSKRSPAGKQGNEPYLYERFEYGRNRDWDFSARVSFTSRRKSARFAPAHSGPGG
jgi:hypothetical protein